MHSGIMKQCLIIVLCTVCLVSAESSRDCKEEFAQGTEKYINKADGIVHAHKLDLDLDKLEQCIDDAAHICGESWSRDLGANYQNVPNERLERCAEESMSDAQDQMEACMKEPKNFPDVKFGSRKEQKKSPGLKLIILLGTLKQTYKTCRDVIKCVPDKYKAIKSDLCHAQKECFEPDFERRCKTIEKDVTLASCQCYKSVPDKQGIVKEFNNCCGVVESRSLITRVGTRVAQNGLLKNIERKVCKDDYTKKFGICEDDELERASSRQGRPFQAFFGGGSRWFGGK